jgi:hypothetical protein
MHCTGRTSALPIGNYFRNQLTSVLHPLQQGINFLMGKKGFAHEFASSVFPDWGRCIYPLWQLWFDTHGISLEFAAKPQGE